MNNYKKSLGNYSSILKSSNNFLIHPNPNWYYVSKNNNLSDDFIYEFIIKNYKNNNFFQHRYIRLFPNVLEKFVEQNILKLSENERKEILNMGNLSEKIILNFLKTKKYYEEINIILTKQNLSELFIRDNFNIFDYMSEIILYQKISEKFIYDNYFDKRISYAQYPFFWEKLLKNNKIKISEKFILEYMPENIKNNNSIIKLIFYQTNIELSDDFIRKYIKFINIYDVLIIYDLRNFNFDIMFNILKNAKNMHLKISSQTIYNYHINNKISCENILLKLIINNSKIIDKILIKYKKNLDDKTILYLLCHSDKLFDKFKTRIEKYLFIDNFKYIYLGNFDKNNTIYKIFNGENNKSECDKIKFLFDKNIIINWNYITKKYILNDFTINKYFDKIKLENVEYFEEISEDFIEKWSEKLNWEKISLTSKYREDIEFINKWQCKINFSCLIKKNKKDKEIITKFYKNIKFDEILHYVKIDNDIIELYKNQITNDEWSSIIRSIKLTPEFIKKNKEIIKKYLNQLFVNDSLTNEIISEIFKN